MTGTVEDPTREARFREMLSDELETSWLYDRLAQTSKSAEEATTLRGLAQSERRHARHWAELLGDLEVLDRPVRPSLRVRMLSWLARIAGVRVVLPRLRAEELSDIQRYQAEPESANLAEEEREHRAALGELDPSVGEAEHGIASASSANTFRAALFGLNDGLVSNLSLIAGVAGAAVESDAVLIAGIAGWLAGAFSMGVGEYISVRSQIELFEHQIAKERLELEFDPVEERAELIAIYERKGVSTQVAELVADELMRDPAMALKVHAREELGLDPDDLGHPWAAAISSFFAFSIGAVIPVLPFVITSGYNALIAAIIAGALMLGLAGMLTSLLTGRHPFYAGGRMVLIGLIATGVTFGIGSVIPVDL